VTRDSDTPDATLEALADVGFSRLTMDAYRALIQRRPFERDFLVSLVDGVLMPALRGPRAEAPSTEPEHTS
jgi:hypothetical protein